MRKSQRGCVQYVTNRQTLMSLLLMGKTFADSLLHCVDKKNKPEDF